MDLDLEGKVALITGGSQGVGRAIAMELAKEGTRVAICARNAEALQDAARAISAEYRADVLAVPADVSRGGSLQPVVDEVIARWGRLDILVNNAGSPAPGSFDGFGDADWQYAFELTLMNVVRSVRAVKPYLIQSSAGRVVNILSSTAREPRPDMVLSGSLRSAVMALAKSLSRELGPHRVTVNNVCPEHILTRRLKEVAQARRSTGASLDLRAAIEAIPLKRLGTASEVAALVAFLVSGRAGYVTGTTIAIDGGSTTGA